MRSIAHRARAGLALMAAGCAMAATLAGCGGGGGGSNGIQLQGTVIEPLQPRGDSRAAYSTTPLANATIQAYVWPDMTTPILSTTTDSNGRYTLNIPTTFTGKDIVVLATTPTVRMSTILADVRGSGSTEANIDGNSTATAELVAHEAQAHNITDITSSSVATIRKAFLDANEGRRLDVASGGDLPATFGGGLRAGCHALLTAEASTVIQDELTPGALGDSGETDVRQARQIVGMLRDMESMAAGVGQKEGNSLITVVGAQAQEALDVMQAQGDAFVRLKFVFRVLGLDSTSPIADQPSGQYDVVHDDGGWHATRTGNASDGKSWVLNVSSTRTNETGLNGVHLTITPQTAQQSYTFVSGQGSYSLVATSTADAQLNYTATATLTHSAAKVTGATLTVHMADSQLTTPMTFSGTATGTPAGSGNTNYSTINVTGTLSSSIVTIALGNASVDYYTSSSSGDLKSVSLTNASVTLLNSTNKLTINFANATAGFYNKKVNGRSSIPLVQDATVDCTITAPQRTLQLKGSMHVPTDAGSTAQSTGQYTSYNGTMSYVSQGIVTMNGSLDMRWEDTQYHDLTTLTANLSGTMTPAIGSQASIDLGFAATKTPTPKATLTVRRFAYGTESLAGTITFPINADGSAPSNVTDVVADLTSQPSGYKVYCTNSANGFSGGIYSDAAKTNAVGTIGKADALGIEGLGSALVIKYKDGRYETAASLIAAIPSFDLRPLKVIGRHI